MTQINGKVASQNGEKARAVVPQLWRDPTTFATKAIHQQWYTAMFKLQSTWFHSSIDFFRHRKGYEYLIVPVTTSSISSPFGLGSDSEPVQIQLHGANTYLADSQQFVLEYALRLEDGLQGSYYVGTSCRGEDHDEMHLNQFTHVECELLGELEAGLDVANAYIANLVEVMLEKHTPEILAYAGTTSHLTDLLQIYKHNNNSFPTVTLDEALAMPEITPEMWKYVIEGKPEYGRSLTRAGERMLIKKFGGVCWLTEMDHQSVPFYQAYLPSNPQKARCADLLLGPGEVLGCGQRHATADEALQALAQHEVDPNEYKWYLDIRKEKPMTTTGWGIGLERILIWIMKHNDVRDAQLLPRLKGIECNP